MVTDFSVSSDQKTVAWKYPGGACKLTFVYPVFANHVTLLDEIIVQADVQEFGERNLFLYKADGSLSIRPVMPKLKHKVQGVYAVWFVPDKIKLTVVLASDEYKPYDTACTFDLKTHKFSNFHPTS